MMGPAANARSVQQHGSMRSRGQRLVRLGVGIGVAGAVWFVVAGAAANANGLPMSAVFLATILAVVGVRRLGDVARRHVTWLVLVSPLLLGLVLQRPLLGDGVLGYANASATLAVIAAAAGFLLAGSEETRGARAVAWFVSAAWLVVPWALGSSTAALAGIGVLAAATVFSDARRGPLVGAAVFVMLGLLALVVGLGATYEPGPRSSLAAQTIDRSLGELRLVVWSEAIDIVVAEPLLGIGPGRYRAASPPVASSEDAAFVHNEFLHVAAESGVVGGLFVLALVAWIVAFLSEFARSRALVIGMVATIGTAANASIDYVWHFAAVPLTLGLLVGAASGVPERAHSGPTVTPQATIVGAATLALWIALVVPLEVLNPAPSSINGAGRPERGVLAFDSPGLAHSPRPPAELYERFRTAKAFTVESWAATTDTTQAGPARMLSSSDGIIHRNLTLGQEGEALVFRLRTTETDWNGLDRQLEIPRVFTSTGLRHLVVATDLENTAVYVDGRLRWSGPGPGGTLDGWNHTYPLLVGNESTGDRPWLGELHGVAFHDRMLSPDEVAAAFLRGPHERPTSDDGLVARYTFLGTDDGRIDDTSSAGLGGDLVVPARVPAPLGDPFTEFKDLGEGPLTRTLVHLALFFAWAVTVAGAVGQRLTPRARTAVLVLAASALSLVVTIVRYATAHSPAWGDFAAAVVGSLLAGVFLAALRRSSRDRPLT
jgi:hypothetical protein